MSGDLDRIMLEASESLVRMDYLSCERLCLEALRLARDAGDWSYYCRILMPLQESRRQRRMIASEGTIRLGTGALRGPAAAWLEQFKSGCVVVTKPFAPQDASQLLEAARAARRHVEVLYCDNDVDATWWTLRSFTGPQVQRPVEAPPAAWVEKWLAPMGHGETTAGDTSDTGSGQTAADWFIAATELLGDSALDQVGSELDGIDRVSALEQRLAVVTDHEILHQRLWDAARGAVVRG